MGGGVRHVWDLIGMSGWRRNMSMGCDRSGWRGHNTENGMWYAWARVKVSMECGMSGWGEGVTRVWDVVGVGEGV